MMALLTAIVPAAEKSICLMSEDIRMLAAIGFLTARVGLTQSAICIFHGLSVLRPEADFPQIGMVMAYLAKGDAENALRIASRNDDQKISLGIEVRALQALSLHLLDRKAEASQIAQSFLHHPSFSEGRFPIAEKIATLLLANKKEYDRYLS
jgi:hypothetical protein